MRASAISIVVCAIALASPAVAQERQRVVDLGHPLAASDPTWTGERVFSRKAEQGEGYVGGTFSSDEHFGTHLDAPAHFGGAWTVDKIPVNRLVRPGMCINISARASTAEDYQLTAADVRAFEAKSGRIPDGAIVLVATGWDPASRRTPRRCSRTSATSPGSSSTPRASITVRPRSSRRIARRCRRTCFMLRTRRA